MLKAVAFCHRHGALHRNIKPKHILIDVSFDEAGKDWKQWETNIAEQDVNFPFVKLSDFSLLRPRSFPHQKFTAEVVTLWYRAPEILLSNLLHVVHGSQ